MIPKSEKLRGLLISFFFYFTTKFEHVFHVVLYEIVVEGLMKLFNTFAIWKMTEC